MLVERVLRRSAAYTIARHTCPSKEKSDGAKSHEVRVGNLSESSVMLSFQRQLLCVRRALRLEWRCTFATASDTDETESYYGRTTRDDADRIRARGCVASFLDVALEKRYTIAEC